MNYYNYNSVIFYVLLAVSDHEGGLCCAGLAEGPVCALASKGGRCQSSG